jgi:hypothetical protein
VFLGADEASIRDSVAIGVAAQSSTRWEATKGGTDTMFKRLSKETLDFRSRGYEERRMKSEKFFEDEEGGSGA